MEWTNTLHVSIYIIFSTSDVCKSAVIVTADNTLTIAFGRRVFETGYTDTGPFNLCCSHRRKFF